MRSREFDRFWRAVERSLPPAAPPRVEAGTLLRHWRGLREKDRGDCMNRLLKRLLQDQRSYGVALFLLEGLTEHEHLRRFAEHLLPLPGPLGDEQEGHLADLVRVLGATDDERTLSVVETYLLERPIATYWHSVPWSLWPHRMELFGRAWERFFLEQPVKGHSSSVLAILVPVTASPA